MYQDVHRSFRQHVQGPYLWSTMCHFYPKQLPNFMQNIRIRAPSRYWKCDSLLWRDTSIAAWVFHNLHQKYEDVHRSFRQHIQAPYDLFCVISTKKPLIFHAKYQILGTLSALEMWCFFGRKDTPLTTRGSYTQPGALIIVLIYIINVRKQSISNWYLSLWHIVTFSGQIRYPKLVFFKVESCFGRKDAVVLPVRRWD